MSFKQAVINSQAYNANNMSRTANGALALKSTTNPVLDLFFMAGSLRNKELHQYSPSFDAAFTYDKTLTMQLVLWLRDIRGGAGERNTTRNLLKHMEKNYKSDVLKMIPVLAEFGRWDDLLIFTDNDCKALAYSTIVDALRAGNSLAAKWMPRVYKMKTTNKVLTVGQLQNTFAKPDTKTVKEINHGSVSNQNRKNNNKIAHELMTLLNMNERAYRKLLSSLSTTVEQDMCSNKWDTIEYSKLPSVAGSRYLPAFMKHDETRYRAFLDSLAKGETKINAAALYPYDVIKNVLSTSYYTQPTQQQVQLGIAQWNALTNYMGDNKVIPMVDTSGSMSCTAGDTTMSCMTVAVSLGLYIADKQEGAFKDLFLNFSNNPQLIQLKGKNIAEKAYDLYRNYSARMFWDQSTNIVAAFDKILVTAIDNSIPQEEMPEKLVVLSDMEFNNYNATWGTTAYQTIKRKFEQAGYVLPTVVFWNLNARAGNNPVSSTQDNVSMVSGFSPSVLKAVLSGKTIDPVDTMLAAIDVERYRLFK